MYNDIEVVSTEEGAAYFGPCTSGCTDNITLRRGDEYVRCEGIMNWDDELADDSLFDEWVMCAEDGEEGYTYWQAD